MTRYRHSGFTLIELMFVLAVGAILLLGAVPGMQTMMRNNRLATQTNEFVTALQLARSEAARRNRPVTVAAVGSDTANEFGEGWEVFDDSDGDGTRDANEVLIRQFEALRGDNSLDATPDTNRLRFLPTGMMAGAATVTFDVCHAPGLPGRRITLLVTGRVAIAELTSCP